MRLISRRPKRDGMLGQHPRRLLHCVRHARGNPTEFMAGFDRLGNKVISLLQILGEIFRPSELQFVEQRGEVSSEFGEVFAARADKVGAYRLVGDIFA